MNLTIDVGNTLTKLAIFDQEKLIHKTVWQQWDFQQLSDLITNHFVKKIIYSTVKDIPKELTNWMHQHFFCIQLTANTPLPIKNLYKTPETLGKDRLAAVVGAYQLYPQTSCLIIDAGTCVTYDILTERGEYIGGNIAPGIAMRLKAMHHFTAKLPLLEIAQLEQKIGNTTETAMRSGAQWGLILEIEGHIRWCEKKFGRINVILTGGDTNFLDKNLKTKIFAHPNLVLVGLNKILNYNAEILE